MRWNTKEKTLWALGAMFAAVAYGGVTATGSAWPWIALAGILALLATIALAARRRLPFAGGI